MDPASIRASRPFWLVLLLALAIGCAGDEGRGADGRDAGADAGSCARRLDGTALPRSYRECVAQNGSVVGTSPATTCTFHVSQSADPDRYAQCERVGGGLIAGGAPAPGSEGSGGGNACKIVYPEAGGCCLGNACD